MIPCVCLNKIDKKEATVVCEHCCSFVFLAVLMSLGHEEQDKEFLVLSEEQQWVGKCGHLQYCWLKDKCLVFWSVLLSIHTSCFTHCFILILHFVVIIWSSFSWFIFHPVSLCSFTGCVCVCLWACFHLRGWACSEDKPASVCQACLQRNYRSPFSGSARRGYSKVVTFGGVTEIGQPVDKVTSSEWEETELLRRLLSKATVAMPTIGLGSQLSERGHRYARGQKDNLLQWLHSNAACITLEQ